MRVLRGRLPYHSVLGGDHGGSVNSRVTFSQGLAMRETCESARPSSYNMEEALAKLGDKSHAATHLEARLRSDAIV